MKLKRFLSVTMSMLFAATLVACGGGGSNNSNNGGNGNPNVPTNPVVDNQVPVVIDKGSLLPGGGYNNTPNVPYVNVTICQSGTSNCATLDHIIVDTGSTGLRVFENAGVGTVLSSTPYVTDTNGLVLSQCMQFADSFAWGTVKKVDVKIGNKVASNIPIEVLGDSKFTSIPSSCINTGGTNANTIAKFGAKGILGIGNFINDCGLYCEDVSNNTVYYVCDPANINSCSNVAIAQTYQVVNPITKFDKDNNGSVLTLDSVASNGAVSSGGVLTFGVGTQTNNTVSGQFYSVNYMGGYNVTYNGNSNVLGIVDSGSSVYFFNNSNIAQCTGNLSGFYCPTNDTPISATLSGSNNVSTNVNFTIGNALSLVNGHSDYYVQPKLAATSSDLNSNFSTMFDLGLPFFYGKSIATTIEGTTHHKGTGAGVIF